MGILDRFKKEKAVPAPSAPKSAKVLVEKQKEKAVSVPAKEEKSKKSSAKKASVSQVPAALLNVIVRPVVSEKSASLATDGRYVFHIHPSSNRIQVRQAVKALYGVMPTSVNIINVRGKRVRFGRVQGKRSISKKAIVTLPKGTTIDVYEGV